MACEVPSGTFVAGELFGTVDDAIVTIGSWNVPSCIQPKEVVPNVPVIGMLDAPGQIAIADAYGDEQTYHFVAQSDGTYRSAVASGFAKTPPQFELLAVVLPFAWTVGEHVVRWTPITDCSSTASIELSTSLGTETMTASKTWLDRRTTTRLAFDEDGPPGYRWHLMDPAPRVIVERWSPNLVLTSSTTRTF